MCTHKPGVLWIHATTLLSFCLVLFCMLMWLFIGGFYPSYRFEITWFWSLSLYMYATCVSLASSIVIYKEIEEVRLHKLCVILITSVITVACILSIVVWPKMSASEFETYVFDRLENVRHIPRFMEYFQARQKCCGITNYKDYINFHGTRIENSTEGKRVVVFDVPRSCCQSESQVNRSCGFGIPLKDNAEIKRRLNSDTVGCYEKFKNIIYEREQFQVTIFHEVFRAAPILIIIFWVILLFTYLHYFRKQFSSYSAGEADEEDSID